MKNFDPNITWGKAIVKVTLQQWEHKGSFEMEFGGNVQGAHALEMAFDPDNIADYIENDNLTSNDCQLKLIENDDCDYGFSCVLKNEAGDEMEIEEPMEEIMKMIVAVEITSYERKKEDPFAGTTRHRIADEEDED